MSTPLTPEELAEVDEIRTHAQHRAFCDKVKEARGGVYPSDWYEKMLATGKNDEVARRYGAGGFRIKSYKNTKDLLRDMGVEENAKDFLRGMSVEEIATELSGADR